VRDWDLIAPDRRDRITSAFRALGRRVVESRVEILVLVAPDHWVNFFLDNMPNVCIGIGAAHAGPPEPFMKAFPHRLEGAPEFANHILQTALDSDFEPSVSHRLTLDHGACIPLWRMELPELPRLVPFIVNVIEPPMPNVNRCLAWDVCRAGGRILPRGFAHRIAGDGRTEPFDRRADHGRHRRAIRPRIPAPSGIGRRAGARRFSRGGIAARGNGTDEVRNWLVAHGMAGGAAST